MADLILLGAGASYGSDSGGTPPLGAGLFAALRQYNPQGWGQIPVDLAGVFEDDFERGMIALSEGMPHSLPPLQRAMAAYFFGFLPRTSNLYVQLGERLKSAAWNGAIATLNYERMLELCLGHVGLQPVVGSPTNAGSTVELLMPHGCCHIFCDTARGVAGAVSFSGMNVQTSGEVRVIGDPNEFRQRIEGDAFPPVMSYFEPRKRTTSGASFIDTQRRRWEELAAGADQIVMVGIRVRPDDEHVWDPISESDASLVYCGGEEGADEFQEWSGGRDVVALRRYFDDEFEEIMNRLGV